MRSPRVNGRLRRKTGRPAGGVHKEGGVLVRERKPGRIYALRFRAYTERQYVTLGYEHDSWSWDKEGFRLKCHWRD